MYYTYVCDSCNATPEFNNTAESTPPHQFDAPNTSDVYFYSVFFITHCYAYFIFITLPVGIYESNSSSINITKSVTNLIKSKAVEMHEALLRCPFQQCVKLRDINDMLRVENYHLGYV